MFTFLFFIFIFFHHWTWRDITQHSRIQMCLNASWLGSSCTTMYWYKHKAIFSSDPEGTHCWTWSPPLMNAQWQWNKQQPWLVTLIAGGIGVGGHACPWHQQKRQKKKYSEIKPYLQKGVTECKTTRKEWDYLFHRESDFFPQETVSRWKQMLLL